MTLTTPAHRSDARTRRPAFANVLRSEWIKLLSVPTSLVILGGIFLIGLTGSLFLATTLESTGVPSVPSLERTMGDVTMPMVICGQIIAGILGVMMIGAEYSSGTIQLTLLATPDRLRVLWAKALVAFSAVTGVAAVTVLSTWAATYPFYAEHGLAAPLTGTGVAAAMIGSAAYLGFCSLFGLGVGTLVRSTTAGSIVVFAATLLIPVLSSVLPYGLVSRLIRIALLGNAGDAMSRVSDGSGPFLDLWSGHISTAAGWVIAAVSAGLALAAGAIALRRRDA